MKKYVTRFTALATVLLCFNTTVLGGVVIDNNDYYNNVGYRLNKITTKVNYKPTTTSTTTKKYFIPTNNATPSYGGRSYYDVTVNKRSNTITVTRGSNNSERRSNSYKLPKTNNNNTGTSKPVNTNTSKPSTPTNIPTGSISANEKQLFNMVNNERIKNGLKPLTLNTKLFSVAKMKSQDMQDNNYFSHTSPTFGKTYSLIKKLGIPYSYAGENIAKTYSVSRAHSGFMGSDGHRKNILNPNFTQIGIGIVGNYYTQVFIK
ncbi:CAP domain-containing protein [Clostridiaceae bacterium M8S5]|nr:CAP domain-containing protein [Clostridiaceae bacterium M8S5]